jgi:hypothetical protein
MEAGLPPEMPHPAPPLQEEQARQKLYAQVQSRYDEDQNRYEQPRPAPSQPKPSQIPRARPQMPAGLGSRSGPGPIGVAISRPTQIPQWPLVGTIENVQDSGQYQPPAGRAKPPQRPPRPSRVPSMLDASRLQDHTPSFQYKQPTPANKSIRPVTSFPSDDDESDYELRSPITASSRPSTISSVGTIPDFPVPVLPQPAMPRRSANLGPPPSSRRGISAYYSQASFVSPIPEESIRSKASHGSYASSAAIPSNWGSEIGSPGYDDDDYEKYGSSPRGFRHDVIEEGRESRESNFEDGDEKGLIRSASLGKKAKPTMITTRSTERVEARPAAVPHQPSKLERMGIVAGVAGVAGISAAQAKEMTASRMVDGQRESMWPMEDEVASPLAGGTGLIDKSSSSSAETIPQIAQAVTTNERTPMPPSEALDTKGANEMLGAYNAASSLEPGGKRLSMTGRPAFSRLSAIRRPPKLDINAVRDAEARGSLTSLPDLIRRATKLAAMMDRGRRPASRLAWDDFPSQNELDSQEKEMGSKSFLLHIVF